MRCQVLHCATTIYNVISGWTFFRSGRGWNESCFEGSYVWKIELKWRNWAFRIVRVLRFLQWTSVRQRKHVIGTFNNYSSVKLIAVFIHIHYSLWCITRPSPHGVASHPVHVTVRDRRDQFQHFQNYNIIGVTRQTHLFFRYENFSVTSVSPQHAYRTGDTVVTLTGRNLDVGSSIEVTVAGIPCVLSGYWKSNE